MIWAAAIWGFIRSPFGIVLVAALGLLAVEKYGEHKVYVEWRAANVEAKNKIDNTDKRIGEGVDKVDKTETANNEQIDKRNQEARNAYVTDLEKRNAECPAIDGDPLKWLRDVQ